MKENEKEFYNRLAPIIRCARKMNGLDQYELADAMEVDQASLSRYENAVSSITSYQWLLLCQRTGIDPDTIRHSYIETLHNRKTKYVERVGLFRIPPKYGKNTVLRVHEVFVLFELFKDKYKEEYRKKFRTLFRMDSDYFYNLDHKINLRFIKDMVEHLQDVKHYSMVKIKALKLDEYIDHDWLIRKYEKIEDFIKIENKTSVFTKLQKNNGSIELSTKTDEITDELRVFLDFKLKYMKCFHFPGLSSVEQDDSILITV